MPDTSCGRHGAGGAAPPHRVPHPGDRLVSTTVSTSPPTSTSTTSPRSTCSTAPRCTAACWPAADHLVGPLARFALNADHLAPRAAALAAELGLTPDERNPFRSIVCAPSRRCTLRVALAIVEGYTPPARAACRGGQRAGVGCGWSERRGTALAPVRDREAGRIVSARSCRPRRRTSRRSSTT